MVFRLLDEVSKCVSVGKYCGDCPVGVLEIIDFWLASFPPIANQLFAKDGDIEIRHVVIQIHKDTKKNKFPIPLGILQFRHYQNSTLSKFELIMSLTGIVQLFRVMVEGRMVSRHSNFPPVGHCF